MSHASETPGAGTRPNILMILVDDLGRADYSAFGTPDIRTPNIDRVFREGVDFTNFFANSPVCSPSRASLMTGCYPDRVGVPGVIRQWANDSWGYLAPSSVLIPRMLRPAGYHTALVGKWHLGFTAPNTPNARGFDHFHGFLGDMMDDYWTHLRGGVNWMRRNSEVVDPQGHATDIFTDWACEYLHDRAGQVQPFFLYLAYNAPHDPIQPPDEWLRRAREREPNMDPVRQKLVALIEHMDHGIGRVLDTLDVLGMAENTLVVFNSDNGGVLRNGANNGPWRSEKCHVYEGGLRVPCGARWPAHITPGSVTECPALTMDLYSTFLDAAGVAPNAGIDGVSLLPAMTGSGTVPEREMYFVRREGGRLYGGKTIEAVRQGDWKLLQDSPYAPLELYNLHKDPLEGEDLAQCEPERFGEMLAALRRHIQRGGEVPWQGPQP
jgi:arylsulfatase A-like enzyme